MAYLVGHCHGLRLSCLLCKARWAFFPGGRDTACIPAGIKSFCRSTQRSS